MEIITKKEALTLGLKKYFTGKPCAYDHIAPRYIAGGCTECRKKTHKEYYEANKRKISARRYKTPRKAPPEPLDPLRAIKQMVLRHPELLRDDTTYNSLAARLTSEERDEFIEWWAMRQDRRVAFLERSRDPDVLYTDPIPREPWEVQWAALRGPSKPLEPVEPHQATELCAPCRDPQTILRSPESSAHSTGDSLFQQRKTLSGDNPYMASSLFEGKG